MSYLSILFTTIFLRGIQQRHKEVCIQWKCLWAVWFDRNARTVFMMQDFSLLQIIIIYTKEILQLCNCFVWCTAVKTDWNVQTERTTPLSDDFTGYKDWNVSCRSVASSWSTALRRRDWNLQSCISNYDIYKCSMYLWYTDKFRKKARPFRSHFFICRL